MLYTPMLPEAASGTLEPRHVVVPLRQMCPHAELLLGARHGARRGAARSRRSRRPDGGADRGRATSSSSSRSAPCARTLPVPGLAEHALGFKDLADAIHLRNHVLRELEAADAELDRTSAAAHLTFVFVGAGYAGVEALAELSDLVARRAALLPAAPRRAAALGARRRGAEDPARDPDAPRRLRRPRARAPRRRDPDLDDARVARRPTQAMLSDGERIPTHTLVWTAGVRANPLLARARAAARRARPRRVDAHLRVEGREHVWALGDCAPSRTTRTPGSRRPADLPARAPPGSPAREEPHGHAAALPLPDARPGGDARPLQGDRRRAGPAPPRLPRLVRDAHVPPRPAAALSRKLRVVVDWTTSLFFRRDIAELSCSVIPAASASEPRAALRPAGADAAPRAAPARRRPSSSSCTRSPPRGSTRPRRCRSASRGRTTSRQDDVPGLSPLDPGDVDAASRGRSTSAPGSTACSPASRASAPTAFAETRTDRDRLLARALASRDAESEPRCGPPSIELGVPRTSAAAAVTSLGVRGNAASRRVSEKLGYAIVGHEHDEPARRCRMPHLQLRLEREQWAGVPLPGRDRGRPSACLPLFGAV